MCSISEEDPYAIIRPVAVCRSGQARRVRAARIAHVQTV